MVLPLLTVVRSIALFFLLAIDLCILLIVLFSYNLSYDFFIMALYIIFFSALGCVQEAYPQLLESVVNNAVPFLGTYRGRGALYILIATLAYCPVFGWKCNIGAMGLFAVGVNYVIFNKKLYELQRSNEAPVFFAPSTNTPISRSYVPPINV
eukprot:TRINITY_DN12705_c0_g1_i2.p1 TRINITY_DN12705_c0_g1~~TRINITY_DN12705_c0_g1_i2.p1  ORF type:complete len:152 (-),score=35.10 TRINITY_DN12705_c0_g1_i2:107-562(-)